jgi:hypothetical protein
MTMEAIDRLLAFEDLRNLKARYLQYLDSKQWDKYANLFVEDGVISDVRFNIRIEGRSQIRAVVPHVFNNSTITVHQVHQADIRLQSPSAATGIWALEEYTTFGKPSESGIFPVPVGTRHGYGHYVDEFVKVDGEWLFKSLAAEWIRLDLSGMAASETCAALLSS